MKIYIIIIIIILCIINLTIITKQKIWKPIYTLGYKNMKYKDILDMKITSYPKKIVIFYHICPLYNWEKIVDEQIYLIKSSGLYDIIDKIYYGCNCKDCYNILNNKFKDDPKIVNCVAEPIRKTHENLTINKVIEYSKNNKDNYILYIHSKGITSKTSYWRDLMNYWNIIRYKDCLNILDRGYHTVGINLRSLLKKYFTFYSGNFWWANSNYISTLDYIKNIYNRINAEHFLLKKYKTNKHISISGPYIYSFPFILKTGLYFDTNSKLNDNDKKMEIKIL